MNCRLGGNCELVSRGELLRRPGVAQCIRCSVVYEVVEWAPRTCKHCHLSYGESLHDPCLGTLPDVVEACCGHGDETARYVTYRDGRFEGSPP